MEPGFDLSDVVLVHTNMPLTLTGIRPVWGLAKVVL